MNQENQTDNDFRYSGLSALTVATKWQDERYRKSIMASLVKGVYVLKGDHCKHRKGSEALAPPWWESFNFKLLHLIKKDGGECSIFGAVYEYIPKSDGAPKYVIAFRGTMVKKDSFFGDMKLNMNILINRLHHRSRFANAMQAVENMVSEKGASNIWLGGHSLGAAIAMLAGKIMAKDGVFLESYLYNPPFISVPIERIKCRTVRRGICVARSLIKGGLSLVLQNKQERQQSKDLFISLSPWVPKLFLNSSDYICSGYITYFQHRENMKRHGLGYIGNLATRYSRQGLLMNALGKENWPEEKSHLLPSACVTISRSRHSHDLKQWFTDSWLSDPKEFRYETNEERQLIMA